MIPAENLITEVQSKSGKDLLSMLEVNSSGYEDKLTVSNNNLNTGTPSVPNSNIPGCILKKLDKLQNSFANLNNSEGY